MIQRFFYTLCLLCCVSTLQGQGFPTWRPDGNGGLKAVVEGGITGAVKVASGTTAQRPATPTAGHVRYNSTTGKLEFRDADAWENPLLESGLGSVTQAYDVALDALSGTSFDPAAVGNVTAFRWHETTGNGTNYVEVAVPVSLSANTTLYLQSVDGAIYSSNGTDVAVADGGTGASTASDARTNLGLAIGTNVQAYDADLTTLSTAFATASASGAASLLFPEDTDNGAHKVTLTAPASLSADATLTLASTTGTLLSSGAEYSGKVLGFSRVDTAEGTAATHLTAQELTTTQQLSITVGATTTVIVEAMCSCYNATAGNASVIMVDPGTGTAVELGRQVQQAGTTNYDGAACGAKSFSIAAGTHTFKLMFRSTAATQATFRNRSIKVTVQ